MTSLSHYPFKIIVFVLVSTLYLSSLLHGYQFLNSMNQGDPWQLTLEQAEYYQRKHPDRQLSSIQARNPSREAYADSLEYSIEFVDQRGANWCVDTKKRLAALFSSLHYCGSSGSSDPLPETALQDLANGIPPLKVIKLSEARVQEIYQATGGVIKYTPSVSIWVGDRYGEQLEEAPLVWNVSWSISIENPETKQEGTLSIYFAIDAQDGTILREHSEEHWFKN
jgi:hypothetical protein